MSRRKQIESRSILDRLVELELSGVYGAAYGPIEEWDVSRITDFSNLFDERDLDEDDAGHGFNSDISRWNVSNATNMSNMFIGCRSFNQPLNGWNVSNVTNMSGMFSGCSSFNQPLQDWNVINVKDISMMFKNCENFNQPLNNFFNDNKVYDSAMGMFAGAKKFNQVLNRPALIADIDFMFINSGIQSLPGWVYNYNNSLTICEKPHFMEIRDFNCPICYEPVTENGRYMPTHKMLIHDACLHGLITVGNGTCPICRKQLPHDFDPPLVVTPASNTGGKSRKRRNKRRNNKSKKI